MIDVKMKYQASVFANVRSIIPSSENISLLIEMFRDKELIPNIIQEITPGGVGVEPRIMLNSVTGEWGITIGSNRINIEKNPTDPKGNNLGNLPDFCTDVTAFFSRILDKFKMKTSRLALVTNYLLTDMAPPVLAKTYTKFFNPIEFYNQSPPFEWNSRSVSKLPFNFAGLEEKINAITSVNRIRVELTFPDSVVPLDRIQLLLDLNTVPESPDSRFDLTHINEFYTQILHVHDSLLNEVQGKING